MPLSNDQETAITAIATNARTLSGGNFMPSPIDGVTGGELADFADGVLALNDDIAALEGVFTTPIGSSAVTVQATVTETDLFELTPNSENFQDVGSAVMILAHGAIFNNSGSDRVITFKFKKGATTTNTFALTVPASANARRWQAKIELIAYNAGYSARFSLEVMDGAIAGGFDMIESKNYVGYYPISTDAEAFKLTATLPVADQAANLNVTIQAAGLYRLTPGLVTEE